MSEHPFPSPRPDQVLSDPHSAPAEPPNRPTGRRWLRLLAPVGIVAVAFGGFAVAQAAIDTSSHDSPSDAVENTPPSTPAAEVGDDGPEVAHGGGSEHTLVTDPTTGPTTPRTDNSGPGSVNRGPSTSSTGSTSSSVDDDTTPEVGDDHGVPGTDDTTPEVGDDHGGTAGSSGSDSSGKSGSSGSGSGSSSGKSGSGSSGSGSSGSGGTEG